MSMDINQIMELWRGLSPRLAGAIPGKESPKAEYAREKKNDGRNEDKMVGCFESNHEEDGVYKRHFK
jgi:hypothetical protein